MEKIKSILSPGHSRDDEIMYGTGSGSNTGANTASSTGANTTSNTGAGLGSSGSTAQDSGLTEDPLQSTGNAPKEHGIGRQIFNPSGDKYDETRYGTTATADTAQSGLSGSQGQSGVGGNNNLGSGAAGTSTLPDRTAGNAYNSSSATGTGNNNYDSSSTTGTGNNYNPSSATGTGNNYNSSSATNPTGSNTISGSHNLERDAALGGAGLGAAGLAHEAGRDRRNDQSTSSNYSYPSNTAGSNMQSSNTGSGASRLERDAGVGVGAGGAGLAAHHELGRDGRDAQTSGGNYSNTGNTAGSNLPSSNTASGHSNLGRDAAIGGAGLGAAGLAAEHEHRGHGHTYEGDPCPPGETATRNGPHFVPGPHVTDTANRLDPHVPGEFPDESGHDRHGHHHGQHHAGRDTAAAAGVGAAGYEAEKHHHGHHNNQTASTGLGGQGAQGSNYPTSSSQGTQGSHLGRDAAIAGGVGGLGYEAEKHHHNNQQSTSTGLGSSSSQAPYESGRQGMTSMDDQRAVAPQQGQSHHHVGRDTALAGAGAGGLYEAEKHHHNNQQSTGTGLGSSSSQAPYESGRQGTTSLDDQRAAAPQQGQSHHLGRDAGLAGAGAGAAGLYEEEKHRNSGNSGRAGPTSTDPASKTIGPHSSNAANIVDPRVQPDPRKMKDNSTSDPNQSQGNNHHYARDGAAAGALGAGAYEADKHHHQGSQPTGTTGTGSGANVGRTGHSHGDIDDDNISYSLDAVIATDPRRQNQQGAASGNHQSHLGRDAGVAGAAGAGAYELDKHHHQNQAGTTSGNQQSIGNQGTTGAGSQGHHLGRDAGVAGAAGAGAYELDKHHHQNQAGTTSGTQQTSADPQSKHHLGRDAVAAGGAAGVADHEYNKHDQKEAEKAQKAHNKEIAKEEKHHEKHDKEVEKGEKKHGGLFGFLHKDKTPKDTDREQELRSQGNLREADQAAHLRHQRELEGAAGAGTIGTAGAAYEPTLAEQERNRAGGMGSSGVAGTTNEAYGEGHGHNKLHKEPPASVKQELEQKAAGQHDGIVTDPHTGLPMNVGKYGSGAGGTDGSQNIGGYHSHQS